MTFRRELSARTEDDLKVVESQPDPPVVARLVVEIRSDGSRTIARGALEDVGLGQRVAVEAHGATPLALAASLAKAIFSAPTLARGVLRALLPTRTARKR